MSLWMFGRAILFDSVANTSATFNSDLPEEQATEFEKFDNFTQFLAGFGTEGDTQFGITDKRFRFRDRSSFVADDWKITPSSP